MAWGGSLSQSAVAGRRAVAAGGGRALALVMAAQIGAAVGAQSRPVEGHERELCDQQARIRAANL